MSGFRIEGNTSGNVAEVTTANAIKVDASGTTQPVSGSVTVAQATAANLNATVSGTVGVNNFPTTQPVSGSVTVTQPTAANLNATVSGAVSVSNFPATQPVSGSVTVAQSTAANLNANVSGTVGVNNFPASQPVTGTFFQATQPVSGSVTVTQSGTVTVAQSGPVTVQQTTAANLNATVSGTVTAVQATPANLQVTVTQQPLTKGVQGANGTSVQDLKDSGRNLSTLFMAAAVAATATEALQSLTGFKSGAQVAATTTPAVVTTGKTYRVQGILIEYVCIATATNAQVNLRANTAGVVALTSPIVESVLIGCGSYGATVTAGSVATQQIDLPDGLEFPAGTGLGVSVVGLSAAQAASAAGYVKVSIKGYEY